MTVLELLFPGLRNTPYRLMSPHTHTYNCIAWAAGDDANWWWPTNGPGDVPRYWPADTPREETLASFIAAFATLGFAVCDSELLEAGIERIALFVNSHGVPTHAARQLPTGLWTSKLGASEDIEHELHALEGDIYGTVAQLFKRPRLA
jgi:hypothetical protein